MASLNIDPFSEHIVHFDGLYLENKDSMQAKKVHQLGVDSSKIDE